MDATVAVRPGTSNPSADSYDVDLHAWALRQAALLRGARFDEADIAHVAEEMESLGKEQFSQVRSSLRIILLHMLKWDHQPERRSRSRVTAIRDARDRLEDVLEDSPSLRRRRMEALPSAYRRARNKAEDETGLPLSRFPQACPYSLDDILTRPFLWPEE